MSVPFTRLENRVGVVPGRLDAADLADLWLVHALACLLDACDVPELDRRKLVQAGIVGLEPGDGARSGETGEGARLERLDAGRRAVVFAALALEARLNRVLRHCDQAEWEAVAHLAPAEKFRIAPRLLNELECATEDAELCGLVAEVFGARDELVDAGPLLADPRSRPGPSRSRELVEASATACHFLATLTGKSESGTAEVVREAAEALEQRADLLSSGVTPSSPGQHPDWSADLDFPPDIVGS